MKTAISVPDDIYLRAERLAQRNGRSRSDVYSTALREYVARHEVDEVTQAVDSVLARLGQTADPFVARAASTTLRDVEW
jgi:predicted transcriptional regulator